MKKIKVIGREISIANKNKEDFISITDIAKYKNPDAPADIIKNWLRNKNSIELLGLWEKLHNPDLISLVVLSPSRQKVLRLSPIISFTFLLTNNNS